LDKSLQPQTKRAEVGNALPKRGIHNAPLFRNPHGMGDTKAPLGDAHSRYFFQQFNKLSSFLLVSRIKMWQPNKKYRIDTIFSTASGFSY
jgi:hypothetical protein